MKTIILVLITCLSAFAEAQSLPGSYKTTWLGNNYGGVPNINYIQMSLLNIAIAPDGRVYTNSGWDENHKESGIYKDGKPIGALPDISGQTVATNKQYVVAQNSMFDYNGKRIKTINTTVSGYKSAMSDSFIVYTNKYDNNLEIINLFSNKIIKKISINKPWAVAFSGTQDFWVVINGPGLLYNGREPFNDPANPCIIKHMDIDGNILPGVIKGYNGWGPRSLGIDKGGNLMVGDDGPNHQIIYYDIKNITGDSVSIVKTFGDKGGIASGKAGEVTPTKFWNFMSIGCDSTGNLYVNQEDYGNTVRCFNPDGSLKWEMMARTFVDGVDFDPANDGRFLYSRNEIFKMDYGKHAAGSEWTFNAMTQDRTNYPGDLDVRNYNYLEAVDLESVFIRRVNGERVMYTAAMTGPRGYVYSFKNDIAVYKLNFDDYGGRFGGTWAMYPDKDGDVWFAQSDGVYVKRLQYIGKDGKLVFSPMTKVKDLPAPINNPKRCAYDKDNDVFYISGTSPAKPYNGNSFQNVGSILCRYDNWSTNPTLKYQIDLPTVAGKFDPSCIAWAGDYVFLNGGFSEMVKVFNASNGSYVGDLVNNNKDTISFDGWVDITFGIEAHKRTNGEYIVAVEDDYRAKQLLFRWCPTGDCKEAPFVMIKSPSNRQNLQVNKPTDITVETSNGEGTISKVEYFADSIKIGESTTQPYSLSWTPLVERHYKLWAKISNNTGLNYTSIPINVKAGLIDTVAPTIVTGLKVDSIAANFAFAKWNKSTDNYGVAGYSVYLNDSLIAYTVDTIFKIKSLASNTVYNVSVKAFDNEDNTSNACANVSFKTLTILPYFGVPVNLPGKIEAECFDIGGDGAAYHDFDIGNNYKSSFRAKENLSADVDSTTDMKLLGYCWKGDWEKYSVNVDTTGVYGVYANLAGFGGSIMLSSSKGNKQMAVSLPSTGDWFVYGTYKLGNIELEAGEQVLTLEFTADNFNNNWDYLIVGADTQAPSKPLQLKATDTTKTSISISWSASTDDIGVKEYKVYLNNILKTSTVTPSLKITGLTENTTYSVNVIAFDVSGKQSASSDTIKVKTLKSFNSIENASFPDVTLYPNPVDNNHFTLSNLPEGRKMISITNIAGNVLASFETSSTDYTISNLKLNSGIYIVTIKNNNGNQNFKLIVK